MTKTRFTVFPTTSEPKARVVNYEKKHSNIAKTTELSDLVQTFVEKCNVNSAPLNAAAIPNYDTEKWGANFKRPLQLVYRIGGAKHEGFALATIGQVNYRMDFQGFVDDCGHRGNIALQWGRGNDGVNGGAAGCLLVECGTNFSQSDLLYALQLSLWDQAKIYVSRHMAAQALEKKQGR